MPSRFIQRSVVALLAAAALATGAPSAGAAPALAPANTPCTTTGVAWDTTAGVSPGQELSPGQRLSVPGVSTVMQWDGNLVTYLMTPDGHQGPPLWSSGTWGNWGAHAVMQTDGNFVIYRQGSTNTRDALWSTRTWGHPGMHAYLFRDGDFGVSTAGYVFPIWHTVTVNMIPKLCSANILTPGEWMQSAEAWLVLQLDGNMVLYRKRDGAALWSSHTYRKPEVSAWMQSDGNLVLRSNWSMEVWSSHTYNNSGAHADLQDDGNFVIYRHDGSNPSDAVWSTGTWRTAGQ
ncbi:hypothetical protein [Kitasatospora sp. NPDC059571]|uniref:hypothetical protein n=1 Tax=Kitasatospora sp. NPDC059571 TaxID=3346871 RepID=UPI003688194E